MWLGVKEFLWVVKTNIILHSFHMYLQQGKWDNNRVNPSKSSFAHSYFLLLLWKSFKCPCMYIVMLVNQTISSNKANLRDLIAATGLAISNWIQIVNFSARVTVKFDGWPCKTIGQLFYATSSFVHHFVPIGEFKLKLQSGNTQSGSNWMIFRAVRPWNLTDDLAIK